MHRPTYILNKMPCGFFQRIVSSSVKAIQDGGIQGWLAVLSLFAARIAWAVLIKGIGMMIPSLQEQFDTSTWLVGWMVAIVNASIELSGIFASPLRDKFGGRAVVTVTGFVFGASMIAASFVSSMYVVTIILTLFTGPALGISYVIDKELVGRLFTESLPTAYGIASLGSALAFVTVIPLANFFMDVYGWRGTMLLLGALLLHPAVCGALLKPPAAATERNDEYQAVNMDKDQEIGGDEVVPRSQCRCSCLTKFYTLFSNTFRLGIFSSLYFWLMVFIISVWGTMDTAWVIYCVHYNTVSKGFTLDDASHFIVSNGIGRVVGCIIIGPLVQQIEVLTPYMWLGISLSTMTFFFLVDPWLTSYWWITANAFIFGNGFSVALILQDVITKDIFGADQIGMVFGWIGVFCATTNVTFLYFPGLMYDTTGSYTVAFSFMGGMLALTVVALLGVVWRQKKDNEYHRDNTSSRTVQARNES